MKNLRYNARVVDGKLLIPKDELQLLTGKLNGKSFMLQVVRHRKNRSLNQNAYYWLILTMVGEELGYLPQEVHEAFKNMFLTEYTGKIPKVRSTSSLSTVDMEDYLQKIRVFALTELNINLPLPNEHI